MFFPSVSRHPAEGGGWRSGEGIAVRESGAGITASQPVLDGGL
ncbi:hypothetical protein [Microcoleus sp. F4-D5]